MEDVTTDSGVTADVEEKEETPKPVSPRDQVLKGITEKIKAERTADTQEDEDSAIETAKVEEEDDYITLKIDGREERKKRDDVLEYGKKAYQKELAADRRLAEAAQRQKEILVAEERIKQREQALKALEVAKQQDPAMNQDTIKSVVAAIYSGDETELTAALNGLVTGQKAPHIDPNQIAEQAYKRVREETARERFQNELSEALGEYDKEYEDVKSDPKLHEYANYLTDVLMKQNPTWGPKQIIRTAASEARELKAKEPVTMAQRIEKKRNLDTVSGASVRDPGKPTKKPKTPAEIVADMKARRSQ